MATFVITFIANTNDSTDVTFRGRVRHVRSGAEILFTSPDLLLDFLETMKDEPICRKGESTHKKGIGRT